MRVTILGKRWGLKFTNLPRDVNGECDGPTEPEKEIRIRTGLSEKETLETILHECLHAADWSKDEAWVEDVACDLAAVLRRLGYRRGK